MSRSRLGPLALESKLGDSPSQSSVWNAVHVKQRMRLAVKVFSLPFGGTTESRQELMQEWDQLKRISHPSIARCYGGGFEQQDAYLVYELVDGETLTAQLDRRGRLPWETVLDYADHIIGGLIAAHEMGYIHGALDPDKIMIEPLGQARIIDFRVNRFDSPYHTNRPATSLHYACRAPEVIVSTQNLSAKSDLYSVGAVLYFALTGAAPFQGETAEQVAAAVASQTAASINTLVLDCPVWFSTLIDQLLSPDPEQRPFSAQAAALALAEVRRKNASGISVAQHVSSGFSPLKMKADKQEAKELLGIKDVKQRPADGASLHEKVWVLLLALITLIGIVVWVMLPPSEAKLRQGAERLLASESRTDRRTARDSYLKPLVDRFPDGPNYDWALEQIDEIEMLEAEYQLKVKLKHGRTIRNEAERLYSQGLQFEQFGDLVAAMDQYRNMLTLLDEDDPASRPYLHLARRQIQAIQGGDSNTDQRTQLVEAKLREADKLAQQGRQVEARKIWYSIEELYANNQQMQHQVQIAQERLADTNATLAPASESQSNNVNESNADSQDEKNGEQK